MPHQKNLGRADNSWGCWGHSRESPLDSKTSKGHTCNYTMKNWWSKMECKSHTVDEQFVCLTHCLFMLTENQMEPTEC